MDMSCGIFTFIGVALVAQWFIILFYCRFKFKTRYSLATVIAFVGMFVFVHLGFNCFHWYGGTNEEQNWLHERDYDPRIRSIAGDDFRRELLHTYDQQPTEGDRRFMPQVAMRPDYGNYGRKMYGEIQPPSEGNYDNTKQYVAYEQHMNGGIQQVMGSFDFVHNGERGNLATNRRKEDINVNVNDAADEAQWQQQWNANIPSVHAALNGLQNDMDNFDKKLGNDEDDDSYDTDKEIKKNLGSNIYNDVKQTVVTMKEYELIAQHIMYKSSLQEKYVHSLDGNFSIAAWKEVEHNVPFTVQETLARFGSMIPWWEQEEITYYKDIYYLGLGADKIYMVNNRTINFGFDFEPNKHDNGEYIAKEGDHVAYRYKILKYLGSGSYGVVVKAYDYKDRRLVAIKFMVNEKDWWDGSIMREMKMMLKIENDAPRKNFFPRVLNHFMFRNHKCVVMELLGESMYRHHRNDVPIHNMTLLRRYASDILNAMADLEHMHVIHGDLKPDNIMYLHGKNNKSNGQLLKVADFGLGCVKDSDEFKCKENHLQTRYYRCPEVMFSLPYDTSCDMFSVGVILAEFYLGKPPFWGETNTDQVAAMMEVLGLVPPHMIEESPWQHVYRHAVCYVTENGFKRKPYRKPLSKVLDGMPDDYYNLIAKCLEYEPSERITASEALRHPFMFNTQR